MRFNFSTMTDFFRVYFTIVFLATLMGCDISSQTTQARLIPSTDTKLIVVEFQQDYKAFNYTLTNTSKYVVVSAIITCYSKPPEKRDPALERILNMPRLSISSENLFEKDDVSGSEKKNWYSQPGSVDDLGRTETVEFKGKILPNKSFSGYTEFAYKMDSCYLADLRGREKTFFDF